jgi:protein SCO1/2
MRLHIFLFSFCLAVAAAGCQSASSGRTYPVKGQILSILPDGLQASIKHEEIKGLMVAMTMTYKVKEKREYSGLVAGDLIEATLVVATNEAYLIDVKKVGHAPVDPADVPTPSASSGFELLRPGDAVPDARFVDQNGVPRTLASFQGSPLVITFIYTQCPLPDFCPLMDRHFASIQRMAEDDPSLGNVRLLSVSFDPVVDTPAVLKAHARELDADEARWTFVTGDRDEVDQFGARFGLTVSRALNDPRDIAHNLRTAIVDAGGKLVKVYTGNEWTPAQIVADLKKL